MPNLYHGTLQNHLADQIFDQPLCQQDMRACRPSLTGYPVPFLLAFSTLHIFFAVFLMFLSKDWEQIRIRYDDVCEYNKTCIIKFNTTQSLTHRLYAYYELGNFYQNHFRFRGSRSYSQLYGKYLAPDHLLDCDPLITIDSADSFLFQNVSNSSNIPLAPCGLRAYYMFTDLFELPGDNVTWNETGISWDGEIGHLFRELNENYPEESLWMNKIEGFSDSILNERFIVWFRTAPTPNFRKLLAWTKDQLPAGQHTLNVTMNYAKEIYDGERWIVLVAQSAAGGRNLSLIVCNSSFGVLYIFAALVTAIIRRKQEFGVLRKKQYGYLQDIAQIE
ncbi:LEM3 (Ligand-effect modulator 3) family protein [Tritrichomonas foetus]|uniref:LEM3 (Ligand-effect modulator 3) family protein n=1 Tax=Tritrichomonas foetus TaxID=1144522 RepID=A0A1J4L5Q6_9EUKA|nr:LEM3 (Ligand-effect modulator 3) family protein [Tritrichomonas foetus]|eukprot:OHT17340.1 LEM3 (Ligand-effect modulator 3) family protein [Tritrichomonas foetus]